VPHIEIDVIICPHPAETSEIEIQCLYVDYLTHQAIYIASFTSC